MYLGFVCGESCFLKRIISNLWAEDINSGLFLSFQTTDDR